MQPVKSTATKDSATSTVLMPKSNVAFGSSSLTPWLCALLLVWRALMLAFASQENKKLLWQDCK